jgi:hypothetical protein
MTDSEVREALVKAGWRQGSVLPAALSTVVRWCDSDVAPPAGARVVVVSHDCDIVSRDAHDPHVLDVIAGATAISPDQNNRFAKNPRRLVVTATAADGESELIQLEKRWKGSIRREDLAKHPATGLSLSGDALDHLVLWLIRAVARSAFPDEFNARLKASKAFGKIRKTANKIDGQPLAIFVDLGAQMTRELPVGEAYEIDFAVVLDGEMLPGDQTWDDFEQQVYEPLLHELQRVEGVKLKSDQLITDAMITWRERRQFHALDLDDLSVRDDSSGATPYDC